MVPRLRTALAGAVSLLILPTSAHAAVVEVRAAAGGDRTIAYAGEPGETNDVVVEWRLTSGTFRFRDYGAPVTPGVGCTAIDAHAVSCRGQGVTTLDVAGGDGDDVITDTVPPVPGSLVRYVEMHGGEGDDRLVGSRVAEGFDGGPGGDYMSGGRGTDVVTESRHDDAGRGVHVTLDARANDGLPGEGDNIRGNIEYVIGGPGADTLIGNSGGHHMYGAGGNDHIMGKRGGDNLVGGDGVDVLEGGTGRDRLDSFDPTGTPGSPADRVPCGNGWDRAWGDRQDAFGTDCEQYVVDGVMHYNRPTAASGRPPGLPAIVAPIVIVRRSNLRVVAGCRSTAACSGTIRITALVRSRRGAAARRKTLARGVFRARAGQLKVVRLKLTRRTRKLARRARRGIVVVVAFGRHGGVRLTRRRVRLR
jgi:Ca2+-binding RTX toxin-like protein